MFRIKKFYKTKSKHIVYVQETFSSENGAVHEIMWKNIVETDRPHIMTWSMRIACWIAKIMAAHNM
jgi:hypothetical protein